jgi:hypothetical protein
MFCCHNVGLGSQKEVWRISIGAVRRAWLVIAAVFVNVHLIGMTLNKLADGTKTDREPALGGCSGLSWERKYYDPN